MKILEHNCKIYEYDEFCIDIPEIDTSNFNVRRNLTYSTQLKIHAWEYFDKFEQAWLSVDVMDLIDKLENMYQEWKKSNS